MLTMLNLINLLFIILYAINLFFVQKSIQLFCLLILQTDEINNWRSELVIELLALLIKNIN